ncbi:hypothetical protein VTK56DRAFT_1830 [Thermocarpiscus australiensis]
MGKKLFGLVFCAGLPENFKAPQLPLLSYLLCLLNFSKAGPPPLSPTAQVRSFDTSCQAIYYTDIGVLIHRVDSISAFQALVLSHPLLLPHDLRGPNRSGKASKRIAAANDLGVAFAGSLRRPDLKINPQTSVLPGVTRPLLCTSPDCSCSPDIEA